MKSVRAFYREEIHPHVGYGDTKQIINLLLDEGFYAYNARAVSFDHAEACRDWCVEYCPDNFVYIIGVLFFDDKDSAMLMKLSVLHSCR
jgi:hypothetical protein